MWDLSAAGPLNGSPFHFGKLSALPSYNNKSVLITRFAPYVMHVWGVRSLGPKLLGYLQNRFSAVAKHYQNHPRLHPSQGQVLCLHNQTKQDNQKIIMIPPASYATPLWFGDTESWLLTCDKLFFCACVCVFVCHQLCEGCSSALVLDLLSFFQAPTRWLGIRVGVRWQRRGRAVALERLGSTFASNKRE